MPLLVLGVLVIIACVAYIYVTERKNSFVRKKPEKNDPFKVIYLPEDLEAEKIRRKPSKDPQNEQK